MKRTSFKKELTIPLKRSKLNVVGHSDTSIIKRNIQALVRELGIRRDGGCILRNYSEANQCGGYRNDGELILQAEHLVSRSNNATFGDMRNIVTLCKYHHLYFKKQHGNIYWNCIHKHIGPELWKWIKAVEQDRITKKTDWKLVELDLKQQLNKS